MSMIIKINNRLKFVQRVSEFHKVAPGKYAGTANGHHFTIEGGRNRGGTRSEWFLDWSPMLTDFRCTGPADAIKAIETC
jgi:hypothetical protein